MQAHRPLALCIGVALVASSCVADVNGVYESDAVVGGEEEPENTYSTFTNKPLYNGDRVKICQAPKGARLRSGPGKSYMVIRVLNNGVKATVRKRSASWYRLELGTGAHGWIWRGFLCIADPGPNNPASYGLSRDGIINIARAYRGFSYWWGGAAFPQPWDDPQGKNKGRCNASSYSGHSGPWGADCSGYVGKAWRLPPALPFTQNLHPYSTASFYSGTTYWTHIARGSTRRADAMVYHSGANAGHILIYAGGSPWGNAWAWEAKGCAWGVTHNLRQVSSSYRTRRRKGI